MGYLSRMRPSLLRLGGSLLFLLPCLSPRADASGPEPVAAKPPPATREQQATDFADAVDDALAKCVSGVQESSVAIWNLQPRSPGEPAQRVSGGSGVFVSIHGKGPYVVTNEHVRVSDVSIMHARGA